MNQFTMGGLSEYSVAPGNAFSRLPESLPYSESAILGCAVFTAYGAVKNGADLRGGESVAVIGVGGVGGAVI
jgi:Zn-dependent alcohol dehydrogenase